MVTAAMVVIGEEILNGRTKDKNIGFIAEYLYNIGIELKEARVIGDVEAVIIETINQLRVQYNYVFTSGGIGPTHDDITADSIAKAFDVEIYENSDALEMLLERYLPEDLTPSRRRMARIPHGAKLIKNCISKAPGFILENVHVMAGVPSIFQVMMDEIAPNLQQGKPYYSVTIESKIAEGVYAMALGEIASSHTEVSIGSYPQFTANGFFTQIIIRGRDKVCVDRAEIDIRAMLISIV